VGADGCATWAERGAGASDKAETGELTNSYPQLRLISIKPYSGYSYPAPTVEIHQSTTNRHQEGCCAARFYQSNPNGTLNIEFSASSMWKTIIPSSSNGYLRPVPASIIGIQHPQNERSPE